MVYMTKSVTYYRPIRIEKIAKSNEKIMQAMALCIKTKTKSEVGFWPFYLFFPLLMNTAVPLYNTYGQNMFPTIEYIRV